jgi:hypothetical protein
VVLGRRDSLTSHFSQSASFGLDGLPSPFSPLNTTFANFKLRNFSQAETITLSGTLTSIKIRYLSLVAFKCVQGRMVIRRLRITEDPSKNREHHPRQKWELGNMVSLDTMFHSSCSWATSLGFRSLTLDKTYVAGANQVWKSSEARILFAKENVEPDLPPGCSSHSWWLAMVLDRVVGYIYRLQESMGLAPVPAWWLLTLSSYRCATFSWFYYSAMEKFLWWTMHKINEGRPWWGVCRFSHIWESTLCSFYATVQ